MKKNIFTLFLLVIFFSSYAQKNLRAVISGENGVTQHFTTLAKDLQIAFIPSKARSTFGLDANSDLILLNTETDAGGSMTHYRYYQTYKGIPVENSMYIAHTKQGRLISMSGSVVTDFDARLESRSSSLSAKEAVERALKYVK